MKKSNNQKNKENDKCDMEDLYIEIQDYLDELKEEGWNVTQSCSSLLITCPGSKIPLKFGLRNIERLSNWMKPIKVRNLKLFDTWAYIAHEFAEIILEIKHPSYYSISIDGTFSEITDLKFTINNVKIELSPVSAMFKLFFHGNFDSDYTNIDHYISLKIIGVLPEKFKYYMQNALYYINSYYLGKTGCFAEVVNLNYIFSDPLNIYYKEERVEDIAKKLVRKRNRKRSKHIDIIPIQLFNYACSVKGTESFLYFYRAIEYFFTKGVLKYFDSVRFNKLIFSEDIVKKIRSFDERTILFELLNNTFSNKVKSLYVNVAKKKGIITKNQFKAFCNSLYNFRCAVVHAKEEQKEKCYVPDVISESSELAFWIIVVKDISKKVIDNLNVL